MVETVLLLATEAQAAAESGAAGATNALVLYVTVFALAVFVGFEIITKIPPTLHTPLMSGSNAISGITLVGSIVCAGAGESVLATTLGFLAVVMATINVVGGRLSGLAQRGGCRCRQAQVVATRLLPSVAQVVNAADQRKPGRFPLFSLGTKDSLLLRAPIKFRTQHLPPVS